MNCFKKSFSFLLVLFISTFSFSDADMASCRRYEFKHECRVEIGVPIVTPPCFNFYFDSPIEGGGIISKYQGNFIKNRDDGFDPLPSSRTLVSGDLVFSGLPNLIGRTLILRAKIYVDGASARDSEPDIPFDISLTIVGDEVFTVAGLPARAVVWDPTQPAGLLSEGISNMIDFEVRICSVLTPLRVIG